MSSVEEVVYQMVTPGEPEQKGRCCLNGVNGDELVLVMGKVALEVEARELAGCESVGRSEIGWEMVGPVVVGGLRPDVSDGETR
jgi:hypothetical protein